MKGTKNPAPFSKTRIFLFLAIVVFVVAGGLYGYIYVTIQNVGDKTASLAAEANQLSAQEATVSVLKSSLAATQEKQTTLHSYFVDSGDIVPFLETLEGYGASTGAKVVFGSVDVKSGPASLDVTLTATGSFTALYRFIALLEAAPYEIGINTSTINSVPSTLVVTGKGPPPPNDWQGNISLSVFSINK